MAYQLWQYISTGKNPTQAEWDALNALASQKASDRMLLALKRAGIDPLSDQGKLLIVAAG